MRTRRPAMRSIAAGALLAAASAAQACGYCVEDRVAAVYDQAIVDSALAHGRRVVFFAVEGSPRIGGATRRAVLTALGGSGTVTGSARVNLENAAAAVAYDPARTDPGALALSAGRALAPLGLKLAPLRVTDAGGKLTDPDRPGSR